MHGFQDGGGIQIFVRPVVPSDFQRPTCLNCVPGAVGDYRYCGIAKFSDVTYARQLLGRGGVKIRDLAAHGLATGEDRIFHSW